MRYLSNWVVWVWWGLLANIVGLPLWWGLAPGRWWVLVVGGGLLVCIEVWRYVRWRGGQARSERCRRKIQASRDTWDRIGKDGVL